MHKSKHQPTSLKVMNVMYLFSSSPLDSHFPINLLRITLESNKFFTNIWSTKHEHIHNERMYTISHICTYINMYTLF